MPLAVGTKAPDFTLSTKTADGPKQIKLSDNFGKKNTLLLFTESAATIRLRKKPGRRRKRSRSRCSATMSTKSPKLMTWPTIPFCHK
jgi:peroxiredoxin